MLLGLLVAPWIDRAQAAEPVRRLLVLGQGPDGHPRETHEYVAGARIMGRLLRDVPNLKVDIQRADGAWESGPAAVREADGVFLFLSEGARWIDSEPRRRQAFADLASRKGGLVVLHWGLGTKAAEPIAGFLELFGGCHGGPDRKYQVLETSVTIAAPDHPVARGLSDFRVRDEFYYELKFRGGRPAIQPIWQALIDGAPRTVAWAWTRPDGGRSFGFSGGHFHANWREPPYQRLLSQAVLWSLDLPIPATGFPAPLEDSDLELPPP